MQSFNTTLAGFYTSLRRPPVPIGVEPQLLAVAPRPDCTLAPHSEHVPPAKSHKQFPFLSSATRSPFTSSSDTVWRQQNSGWLYRTLDPPQSCSPSCMLLKPHHSFIEVTHHTRARLNTLNKHKLQIQKNKTHPGAVLLALQVMSRNELPESQTATYAKLIHHSFLERVAPPLEKVNHSAPATEHLCTPLLCGPERPEIPSPQMDHPQGGFGLNTSAQAL